jgi:hypothetical protein
VKHGEEEEDLGKGVLPNELLMSNAQETMMSNALRGGKRVKQKPNMEEQGIERRLENWGYCQRGKGGGSMLTRETRSTSPYGGQGYKCMTNVVCTLMREAAIGPRGGSVSQAKLDFEDAAVIQAVWLTLGPRHKLLLRDFYVLNTQQNVICRAMNIKHWPASHWQRELRAAQDAVQKIIDSKNSQA